VTGDLDSKSDPEVKTVSVEIHEKHADTFFLGIEKVSPEVSTQRRHPSSPHCKPN
jgi:hypothetical protein